MWVWSSLGDLVMFFGWECMDLGFIVFILCHRGLQRPPFLGGVWHSAVIAEGCPSLESFCFQESLGLVNSSERSPLADRVLQF